MVLLTDYFAAEGDERAASVAVQGPRAVDPATMRRTFAAVELPGSDPFVVLGTLTSLLVDRPYAEVVRHPRHGTLVATAGDEGPWVVSVSEELVAALAATTSTAIDRLAVRWSATAELEGSDPGELSAALHELATLCVRADDTGHRLYCWTSL